MAYIISIGLGEDGTFLSDLNNKKRVAGTAISAMLKIVGPPEKPLISGKTTCGNNGFSVVTLEWSNVADVLSYDVYRNEKEIASGLTDNFFKDESVLGDVRYTYYVVAKGPAGKSISDRKVFLTKKCRPAAPFAKINVFDWENIDGVSITNSRRPAFQGQTNISRAKVELEIHSNAIIYATTQANSEGYWQWFSPVDISYGPHNLYVRIIDPNNPELTVDTSLAFEIIEKALEGTAMAINEMPAETKRIKEKEDEKKIIENPPLEKKTQDISDLFSQANKTLRPFDFNVSITNEISIKELNISNEAYRGENLKTHIEFSGMIKEDMPFDMIYTLVSPDKEIVAQYSQKIVLANGLAVEKTLPLPVNLKLGKYKLKISVAINDVTVSNEKFFVLKDKPVLKVGASTYITYPDLINNLSWIFIVSVIFLLFFLFLVIHEHYLSKKGRFHVTGKVLKRKGFIN